MVVFTEVRAPRKQRETTQERFITCQARAFLFSICRCDFSALSVVFDSQATTEIQTLLGSRPHTSGTLLILFDLLLLIGRRRPVNG